MENPTYIGAIDAFRTTGNRLIPIPVDARRRRGSRSLGLLAGAAPAAPRLRRPDLPQPDRRDRCRAEQRRELVRIAARARRSSVVEDLTPDATLGVGSAAADRGVRPDGDRVITVGSLSKLAWGGLRIGWVRASRPDIDRIVAAKIVADHSSSLITQAIAARVLDDVEAIAAADDALGRRATRQVVTGALAARLPDWEWTMPEGGLSLWVRLPDADAVGVQPARGRARRHRSPRAAGVARRRLSATTSGSPTAPRRSSSSKASSGWRRPGRPTRRPPAAALEPRRQRLTPSACRGAAPW